MRPDGEVVWASTKGTCIRDEDDSQRYVVAHFKDITATRVAEQSRERAQAQFEVAFSAAPHGMALVDLDGGCLRVNHALCELVGSCEAELLGRPFAALFHPDDLDVDVRQRQRLLDGAIERYSVEKRFWHPEGSHAWANLSASVVRDTDELPQHFVVQLQDISARRRLEEKLHRMAHFDPLTDLWNRRRFEEELRRQIGRCQRYRERAALLVIDLNGFKPVNDRFGHEAGDQVLVETARALRDRLRRTDAIGRLGGDEFAILLSRIPADEAAVLADELRAAVADASATFDGMPLSVTASIGVAFLDEHTLSADAAMRQADSAMYDAKAVRRRAEEAGSARDAGAAESRRARREDDASHEGHSVRVLHCDDSEPYRALVRRMLSIQPGIEVAAEAATAADAIRMAGASTGRSSCWTPASRTRTGACWRSCARWLPMRGSSRCRACIRSTRRWAPEPTPSSRSRRPSTRWWRCFASRPPRRSPDRQALEPMGWCVRSASQDPIQPRHGGGDVGGVDVVAGV